MKRTTIIPAIAAILALVLAACGGGEPAATPQPAALTSTVLPSTPVATAVAPAPTGTTRPATPTATRLAPTPTPIPLTGGATPIINRSGKYGGILSLPALPTQPFGFDTYTVEGTFSYELWHPMFNNVIWPDPYGDGQTLVGDLATGWELSEGGRVITISLNKGVKFHDGVPLTSKDVVYNYDRAVLNPRTPTMIFFKQRLRALEKVEAVDDATVRLTLSRPSNSAMLVLAMNQWMQYPSHLPFPEKLDEFKKNPIGSGPFRVKSLQPGVGLEYVRNANYWKPGLPYVDGIVFTMVSGEAFLAGARSGRFDASTFNSRELSPPTNRKTLNAATGWVSQPIIAGVTQMLLNQRPPWTDRRVREAVSLAVDRDAVVRTWLDGAGSPFGAPLLPPEIGGRWGIPQAQMRTRPGFREDKTQDLTRARQLLAEAGVDLGHLTVKIVTTTGQTGYSETVEASLRAVGFKNQLDILPTGEATTRLRAGDFDVNLAVSSPAFDDPSDYLNDFVVTGAGQNWGKWSWPELDRLLDEQDRTQDVAQRKALLLQIQEMILSEQFGAWIPIVDRLTSVGYQPWVKNYYPHVLFTHSPQFRWEQVWLERQS